MLVYIKLPSSASLTASFITYVTSTDLLSTCVKLDEV